ncbi:MAG: hypothetical protein L0227_06855 [Chloroflexi bacterium]|nr:hypothetical protein [Chloroflexota bacterium]
MTTSTLTYVGSLVVTNCWCGIGHAVPSDLYAKAQRDHNFSIYCPLGHGWVFMGETEAQKEKRLRKWAEDRAARIQADLDRTEASRRAWKGQTTRLRNRAAEGHCPFCGRFLVDLAVHVAKRHPDERPRELSEDDAAALPDVPTTDPRITGAAGGRIRAQRLSPERRSEIARAAAEARWRK